MTLLAQWDAAFTTEGPDPTPPVAATQFQRRVCMAVVKAATDIGNEAIITDNHTNRVALAKLVLNAPMVWITPFTFALAAQSLTNSSLDTDISNMIAAVWNPMAGKA